MGEEYENARLLWKNPDGPQPTTTRGKGKANNTDSNKTPALLLANKWDLDDDPDPTGWWISEKLDGVRWAFGVVGCVDDHTDDGHLLHTQDLF